MKESRVKFFELCLSQLRYNDALRALDWLMTEMSASKGFSRHDGSNYYTHPIDCAQDLINNNIHEEPVIIISILHDMQEDVEGVTPRMIENMFGSRVAIGVDLLSKKKDVNYKDSDHICWYLGNILKNRDTALGKTADRKHNFSTLRDATPEKKYRQALETEKFFIPFFKQARDLYPRYSSYFFAAKTAIEPHLWEIKEHYHAVKMLNEIIAKQDEMIKTLSQQGGVSL